MKKLAGLVSTNYSISGLSELSKARPHASIPYGGRYRLIDFPLSNFVNSGIKTVGVITPHFYRSLLDHIGNGKPWALSRKVGGMFILPGSMYGYDISNGKFLIRDCIGNARFFERSDIETLVMSASDKIYNINYREVQEFHEKKGASVTLIYKKCKKVSKDEYVINVDKDGNVNSIDKLKEDTKVGNLFIDSMLIEKDLIYKFIKWYKGQSYFDIMDILKENISHMKACAYEFEGYVKSINNISDYMDANMDLLNEKIITELFMSDRKIKTKIQDSHPAKYFDGSKANNCMIATGCMIKGKVENSIIFRDCYIGKNANIKNCVIMANSCIGDNSTIENCILDKYTKIEEGEKVIGTNKKPIVINGKK